MLFYVAGGTFIDVIKKGDRQIIFMSVVLESQKREAEE